MNEERRYRRRSDLVLAGIVCVLLLACLAQTQMVLRHFGDAGLDLSGRLPGTLNAETVAYLQAQKATVLLTYFVSRKDDMPSHLKDAGRQVIALLRAFQRAAPEQVRVNVIEPDRGDRNGNFYAARRGAAPFKTKEIRLDTNEEVAVWSSIVITRGGHRDVQIQGITPTDVATVERLIVAHMRHQDRPTPAVYGVSAPQPFSLFRRLLTDRGGKVRDVEILGDPVPEDVDVLFWMMPEEVTEDRIRSLHRFLATGRTAVIAGSAYDLLFGFETGESIFFVDRRPGWERLLASFGIRPEPDLLMDEQNGPVIVADSTRAVHEVGAPFHLRVMPGYYNLKGFASHARGALNLVGACPLTVDPAKVNEAGFRAEVLGTTTERATIAALPNGGFRLTDIGDAFEVGKQNLMLRLVPENPQWGEVVILGSASVFRDGIINQPNYGHRVFLQTLLRTFSEPHRLLKSRVRPDDAPDLTASGDTSRIFWRAVVILLGPFLLVVVAFRRLAPRMSRPVRALANPKLVAGAAGALALVAISPILWQSGAGVFLDLTEERLNRPLEVTGQLLAPVRDQLQLQLILSHRASMPASMKHLESALRAKLGALGLDVDVRRPEELSPSERSRLLASGLSPFTVKTVVEDVEQSFTIWSGLLVSDRTGEVVIPRLEPRHLDHLEFLVTAAAQRIQKGRAPRVALISEPPRLSPAEAYEYIKQMLSAPKGEDTYSEVKRVLEEYGYDVAYVNPRQPRLPEDADLVLWFQPRRDASDLLTQFSEHLAKGKPVIVAAQHFNIQQRQYRGSGFKTVYWPQPQFQDLERYINRIGVSQVREVLMDQNRAHLQMETQINRRSMREFESQEVALPFLIRTVRDNYAATTPVTRRLGDQLFVWGNRFAVNADTLSARQMKSSVLISTSGNAWSFDWKGGWLPDSLFDQPPAFTDRQPLAIEIDGPFPRVRFERTETGELKTLWEGGGPEQKAARMVLIGSSEMFKNQHLFRRGFQHDQLLLNVVAELVYGEAFTTLQARRHTEPGFSPRTFATAATWRAVVISAGPLAFLGFGMVWVRRRRTAS